MAITGSKASLAEGIILIILGILAIILAPAVSIGIDILIGIVLIISGIVGGYRALTKKSVPGNAMLTLILATIAIIAGIFLLARPWAGILAITVILTIFFFLEGIALIALAFRLKGSRVWIWYLITGIVTVCLAALVWAGLPGSSFWLLGLLVGINLIFYGSALVASSVASKP